MKPLPNFYHFIAARASSEPLSGEQIAQHYGVSLPEFERIFTTWIKQGPQENIPLGVLCPAPFENWKGAALRYAFSSSPWGEIITVSTGTGLAYMGFSRQRESSLEALHKRFSECSLAEQSDAVQRQATGLFENGFRHFSPIPLHLKGTPFQLQVWQALLSLPIGTLTTYQSLADQIGQPKACRAVGNAVGANPISILIPCHRVVRTSGCLGGYYWGLPLKIALLCWEKEKLNSKI